MAPRPIIYFIRHGETDWNAERRLQGQRDTHLNALGRRQASDAGRILKALLTARLDRGDAVGAGLDCLASPLARTRETALRVSTALSASADLFRFDDRLKELSFGDWEGMTWREIRTRHAREHAARKADIWHFTPPGGESYAALAARLAPLLAERHRDAVIVSHGGVARALVRLACGMDEAEAAAFPVWQGRVLVVEGGIWRWAGVGEASEEASLVG